MKSNKNISRLLNLALALSAFLLTMTSAVFATPSETAPIWRVQLRVQTANVEDAGTDDSVRMALNLYNNTWLDYGRDDFPRNNTFTYDLKLDHVATIADLSHIYFAKNGSDGLALKSIALIVNGRTIYSRVFTAAYWLDNSGGHSNVFVVDYTELRQSAAWRAYVQPFPPFSISHLEIESRVAGMLGDMMHGNRLQWGTKYGRDWVEVTRKAGAVNTLHVDLDLEIAVDNWFNPEVDVDFDVQVRCVNNRITLTVLNSQVNVDSNWFVEVISLGLIEFLDDYLSDKLTAGLKGIKINQNIPVPLCPVIEVDAEGDLNFSLPPSGPVIVFGTLSKQQTPVLTADTATQMLEAAAEPVAPVLPVTEEETAPLTVNVALADDIKANDETTYTLQVKSNREAATNAEIEIALPQLMNVSDATVEVEDAQGKRHISLQPTTGAQGESVLRFNDRLAPGDEQRYSLHVRFLTGTQADLQLTATVTDTVNAASIKSTTRLQLADGVVKPRGTFQAAKGLATERKPTSALHKR